jgi:hypothetical protein
MERRQAVNLYVELCKKYILIAMRIEYQNYRQWISKALREYYLEDVKIKPFILPTYSEWKEETIRNTRQDKLNTILNYEQ